MCVCVCVCVLACVHDVQCRVCVCACMCTHACVYAHVCVCVCARMCVYRRVGACVFMHACMWRGKAVCTESNTVKSNTFLAMKHDCVHLFSVFTPCVFGISRFFNVKPAIVAVYTVINAIDYQFHPCVVLFDLRQ